MPDRHNVVMTLRRMREPVAALVELAVAINVLIGIVRVVTLSQNGGVLEAVRSVGGGFMGVASLLCLLMAVAACALLQPVTLHARGLALIGLLLAGIGFVLSLVFLVAGLFASQPGALGAALEALGGITDLVLKGLAAFFLLYLARISPSLVPPRLERPAAEQTDQEAAAPVAADASAEPAEEELTSPVWSRDKAAGARWNTAADAARGLAPVGEPARAELGPGPRQEGPAGVQPVDPAALEGPAAKADPGLWKRPQA